MAADTSKALRQQVMYCVYVRQYSKEGTFEKVREDLTRIRDLGVDILWLLPIHPIGKTCRKGALGSPYAIRDYRAVNEEYGTMQDFERLAGEVHRLGMRLMIDVVYNHTSPDSWLAQHHPEWFYHRADGSFGNRIGEWSDIIDLDYSHPECGIIRLKRSRCGPPWWMVFAAMWRPLCRWISGCAHGAR